MDAFDALDAGLRRLGMIVESRDPEAGTLTVAAPTLLQNDGDIEGSSLAAVLVAGAVARAQQADEKVVTVTVTSVSARDVFLDRGRDRAAVPVGPSGRPRLTLVRPPGWR